MIQPSSLASDFKEPPTIDGKEVYAIGKKIEKMRALMWVPHAKFIESRGPFSFNGADVMEYNLYGKDNLVRLLGSSELSKQMETGCLGHCEFLKWLNGSEAKIEYENRIIWMNCADYVYLTLFEAGALTKSRIKDIYDKSRIDGKKNYYYGFKLSEFKPLKERPPQMGDIVITKSEDIPGHVMIAGMDGHVLNLWNSITEYSVEESSIASLEEKLVGRFLKVHFFSCPLDQALKNLIS